jgi:hypothetical protein
MADDSAEVEYWLNRKQVIFCTILAEGNVAADVRAEIAEIVDAWYHGQIFPRSAAPTVAMLLEVDPRDEQPPEPPAPIEIAGGVAGFQKLLVEMAKQNRGLDHAALKQLFDAHQVVTAVWENPDVTAGPGFLTLKGAEYLIDQIKRHRTKKIRATMTAFWCNSREHAELLQQAFTGSDAPPTTEAKP